MLTAITLNCLLSNERLPPSFLEINNYKLALVNWKHSECCHFFAKHDFHGSDSPTGSEAAFHVFFILYNCRGNIKEIRMNMLFNWLFYRRRIGIVIRKFTMIHYT